MSEMRIKLDAGKLVVDLYDLLGEFTGEQRADLIDTIACRQEVIDEVMNQVLDGCTTLGSYGSRGVGGDPTSIGGINGARIRIAELASDVAAKEIAEMRLLIERERKRAQEAWDQYHEHLRTRGLT